MSISRILVAVVLGLALVTGIQASAESQSLKVASNAAEATVSVNTTSLKYHKPGCRYFNCKNCTVTTLSKAQAKGAVPCKICHRR